MSECGVRTNVVAFSEGARSRGRSTQRPLLILIDIQREYIEDGRPLRFDAIEKSLFNCSKMLGHARQHRWDIAHVIWRQRSELFDETQHFSEFITGFNPRGSERVFVKSGVSAYSNREFATMMQFRGGGDAFVIGYQGPSACLATLVDGFSRGHCLNFVADASLSPCTGEVDEATAHRRLIDLAGQYAAITTTNEAVSSAMVEHFARAEAV